MNVGIVLAGGGAKGAFQIGALSALLPHIEKNGQKLKAISGTSIGAFNAAFVASGQFDKVKEIWESWNSANCPLVKSPFVSPFLSFLTHGYAYKTPDEFLKSQLNGKDLLLSNIRYINTLVRAADGEMRYGGNIENKSLEVIYAEILASMAAVPITPAVTVDGHAYVDGGFRDTVPTKALIDNANCKLDMVYIIAVNPEKRVWNASLIENNNSSLLARINFAFNDILWDEAHRNDIAEGQRRLKSKCRIIYPMHSLGSGGDFSSTKIRDSIAHGLDMANRTLGFSQE